MLDGILGRGFSVKCKSLIKATGARIAVVRRRAEAKQRFLNEDLAKLLCNGLDINAYGRTEEFLAGMNLLSCYDFVEQSCEYILKQLSRMQKQGECPEECREAVASVMYAAARFSDFPELRDLRDVLQQKYGSSLEAFVNQKFVEKLSLRTPPKEKRLQVLQDIASEFSIKWDSKGFERRMAAPLVVSQVDEQKVDIVKQRPGLLDDKSRIKSYGEGKVWRRDEKDHHVSRRKEKIEYREKSVLKIGGGSSSQGDDDNTQNKLLYTDLKAERSRTSNGVHTPSVEALFREKTNFALPKTETETAVRKGMDEGSDMLKSCSTYALPPPYIKSNHTANPPPPPYVKKEDKQKLSGGSKDSPSNLDQGKLVATSKVKSHVHEKELDSQDERIPLPKPRSIRRKHHKSSSSNNVDEDVKGGSSSRRKDDSRKTTFDDEEERMIDKLLIHYSKKPTSYDGEIEAFPRAARSLSLPPEQAAAASSPQVKKVFARANTFQMDNQAKHVHPKLPDYDDLAARFAALKGR